MSNYGSNTPSGAYQGGSQNYNPQQQGYQAPASNYGQGHKSGGTFGQMMNQAVTTGKPMLDKLGKTLSSKLGNKPAPGPPQHLQSYQNYQNHQNPSGQAQGQGQGYQQQQNQTYSPQPQQQQWQQPQQQPTPPSNSYTPSQPSPFQPNNYGTSTPVQATPNNYFPQQSPPPLNHALKPPPPSVQSPAPSPQQQPPPNAPGYNTSEYGQGQQGQMGQANPAQTQGYFPQAQQDAYNTQQSGVVGANQNPGFQTQPVYPQGPQGPPPTSPPLETPAPPVPQSQWGYNSPDHNPHVAQQQHQQQYPPVSNTPFQQEQQQQQQQQQQHQQQWNQMSPMSPTGQPGTSIPPSVSPPPAQNNTHMPPNAMAHTQPSPPAPQSSVPHSAPTEFIAELPADMGNLKLAESPVGTGAATPASQYQAYNPSAPSASPSKGFSVPRRKVSTSSAPLADPWRFADPVTETPTREFYILADILFDSLDRKFEPQNTGMLEAPKILGSWIEMSEDARNLFSYNGYTALAHQWSLQGIPHFMVPVQPHLSPMWNFDQQAHAQELKLSNPPSGTSSYATYMPALNRAGWYKFFFLEMCHAPNDIDKLMPALCADTYKPGVLNHPDLNRRDKSEVAVLQARATDVQVPAINRVCEEARTAMLLDPNIPASSRAPAGGSSAASGGLQPGSPEDLAVQMHRIQAERQFNDMAVKTVLGAGITFGPAGGYSGGYASLV